MSNELREKGVTQLQDVESLIAAIAERVGLLDCIVLAGVSWPAISAVQSADDGDFRETLPLGDGVHIVLSVGDLPTKLDAGIHEIEV